jgi:glycosyltransferase involved in cell wall biosynthesis
MSPLQMPGRSGVARPAFGDEKPPPPGRRIIRLALWAPDLRTPQGIKTALREVNREFGWALQEGWDVEFWGLRGTPPGNFGRMGIRGPFILTDSLPTALARFLAQVTHFSLLLTHPRAGILYASTPLSGVAATIARLLLSRPPPLIVQVQGRLASRALLVRHSRLLYWVADAMERFVIRRADLVVPIGRFTRELALRAKVPERRIIELPFPTSWGEDAVPTSAAIRNPPRIVCAARLVQEKGVDVLLRAMTVIRDEFPEVRLEIAGDGPERPPLERLAADLGITASVRFLGWLPPARMSGFFASALVAVLPSRLEEGLGMALVEAGLNRCALVGSDLGGIRDVVQPGMTGFLVPPEDPGALASALRFCLQHPEEAQRLGEEAQRLALEHVARREASLPAFRQRIYELWSKER